MDDEIHTPLLDSNDIPSWDQIRNIYSEKWEEEKQKFYDQLKKNFKEKVSSFKSGKIEIYQLHDGPYALHYEKAFRELFSDTGYQASVGCTETSPSGNKKYKPLYITLPDCFSSK